MSRSCDKYSGICNIYKATNVTDCACKMGYYLVPCRHVDEYGGNATCMACPAHSRTLKDGALDIRDCKCMEDYWLDESSMGDICNGQISQASCKRCPTLSTTSRRVTGAIRLFDCWCPPGYWMRDHSNSTTGITGKCERCPRDKNGYQLETAREGATRLSACVLSNKQAEELRIAKVKAEAAEMIANDWYRSATGGIFLLFIVTYLIRYTPAHPRLDKVDRKAIVIANSRYTHYHDLQGVAVDATHMTGALEAAGYLVWVHFDIQKARTKASGLREGEMASFMSLFEAWCSKVDPNTDVVIYLAGHGIKFQDRQWMVMGDTRIRSPDNVYWGCIEINRLRLMIQCRAPRVTILIIDTCAERITFSNDADSGSLSKSRTVRCVELKSLNASRAALDVFTFYGAADATYAKESSDTGGDFTNAFVKHMGNKDQSLDILSQLIRSELTQGSSGTTLKPGIRIEVKRDIMSINETPEKIKTGTRWVIRSVDTEDNSMEVVFDDYIETQWIDAKDIQHITPDEEVQISPTENFLSHDYRGWTFFESSPLCCGMMPRYMENFFVRLIHQHTCSKVREESRSISDINRSVGKGFTPDKKDIVESQDTTTSDRAEGVTSDDEVESIQEKIRALQNQVASLKNGGAETSTEVLSLGIPGMKTHAGRKATRPHNLNNASLTQRTPLVPMSMDDEEFPALPDNF